MLSNDIIQMLVDLIEERAVIGNIQSKHGIEAAEYYELFMLRDTLDKLLTDAHKHI